MQLDLPHKLYQHQTFQATVNKEFFMKVTRLLTQIMKAAGSPNITSSVAWKQWWMPLISVRNRAHFFWGGGGPPSNSPSSEANSSSNGQDIPLPLIHIHGHYAPWLGFNLNQKNSVHTVRTYSLRSTAVLPSHLHLSLTCSLPHFTIRTTLNNL